MKPYSISTLVRPGLLLILSMGVFWACNNGQPSNEKSGHAASADQPAVLSTTPVAMDGELPTREAVPALFDEMDYQQATQCYLWGLPLVSLATFKKIQETTFGATSNDLVVYTSLEDKLGILTANATTPYILSFIDLSKTGPLVIEMPAGHTAGGLTDCWQREMVSIGETGADKGQGGKYILSPPGHPAVQAPGYYSLPSTTMNVWFGFRALDADPEKAKALVQGVKIYPYAVRAHPPQTRIVTPSGKKYYAIQPDSLTYWQILHAILQDEPVAERDRFFMAWLDNLGVKKGQAFNPTDRQKKILIAAAAKGKLMAIVNSFDKRFSDVRHWPDRQWDYVMIISDPSQRAANYDEFFQRSSYFYEAIGYSKSMITKTPNVGQAYLGVYTDKEGNWLKGDASYALHIPANVPAVNFWSITVYDDATRCLIDNAQHKADLSSRMNLLKNNDGSVDLYFGPQAPAGKEANWVQTIPGKHWFVYMRFYGPTEAYFNKSWKMNDIEKTQ